MPMDGIDYATLPQTVALAISTFAAITLCFNKWADSRKADATHVGVLEKERAFHEERADLAEDKAERAWQRVEEIAGQLTELKVQNARLSERVESLTKANEQLSKSLEEYMRASR